MKLKQLLLSALAMVAATTGYAQDISSIVTADEGISFYDDNQDWTISSSISYYDNGVPDQENSYTIYFESESEIEVSFDIDVVTDDNAYLHISFSDGTETSIDYADGRHITHSFEAGENNISFMYGRWDYMVSDEGGPIVMDQRAEVYNIIVKGLCAHEFPEESTYPATCTEPSKSECIKCGKLLSDGKSPAIDNRLNTITIGEGVEAEIWLEDKGPGDVTANPWEHVDESDPSKGLTNCSQMQSNYSNLSIRLTNEEPLLLTFDYELKTTYSCGFTATIDTKDEAVINTWVPEKGQISYVLSSSTEKPHEIDFNYTSWGASQENVGIVISNIKLTSAKETLDTDNDGEIEVNDLVKNLSGTNPTPETLQKIEAIVWYILNKE